MSRSKQSKSVSQATKKAAEGNLKVDLKRFEDEARAFDEDDPHHDGVEWNLARHEYAATMDDRLY